MENFSDTPTKRKVGRPKKQIGYNTEEEWDKDPDYKGRCERTKQNKKYLMIAWCALGWSDGPTSTPEKYEYLYPFKDGAPKQGKNVILYALGRIENDVGIRVIADKICELKLNAKNALQLIKLVRAEVEK